MTDIYENPLITRYASKEMSQIFSNDNRFKLWRKLWIVLAEAEKELGITITNEQIEEMKKFANNINYDIAIQKEKEVRHDVMAHVHAFGMQAKSAMPIIHLGATSCYVTDNAEILMNLQALDIIKGKIVSTINKLKIFSVKYKNIPTLGFTHLQPAQLTTVGKRATLWLQDLLIDLENLEFLIKSTKTRGVKGTTGTQASFMNLFDNDSEKVKRLSDLVDKKLGIKSYTVTGQTYTRKFDYNVLSVLSQVAQSGAKFATDLRLLQSMKEMEEPFEKNQIGSSAMAYKRNPMRTERMCSLSRFVISLPVNAAMTASTQWLERTLDDSANKRIVTAQAFLALDGMLNLYLNVADNMVVYPNIINKHIEAELPFMSTEVILMECVKAGGDRQELHEAIRLHSMESAKNVKEFGKDNDLIKRIKQDVLFKAIHETIDELLSPINFIGRAEQQVDEFISNDVTPILNKNKKYLDISSQILV